MKNKIILLIILILVIFLSGCVSQEEVIKNLAKQTELAKNFLKENPNAEIIVVKLSEEDVSSIIDKIRDKCGPQMEVKPYWKVEITDPDTQSSITSWIDVDTQELLCAYRVSITSQPTTIPITTYKLVCNPCFSYFAYVDSNENTITIRNGPRTIEINEITYNPGQQFDYSHDCINYPCNIVISWIDKNTGLTHTDTATLKTSTPTTYQTVCSPCFSYFAFVDYDQTNGNLYIRNGPRTIYWDVYAASPDTGSAISTTNCSSLVNSCNPGADIIFENVDTSGTIKIEMAFIDKSTNVNHTDSATIHN